MTALLHNNEDPAEAGPSKPFNLTDHHIDQGQDSTENGVLLADPVAVDDAIFDLFLRNAGLACDVEALEDTVRTLVGRVHHLEFQLSSVEYMASSAEDDVRTLAAIVDDRIGFEVSAI